MKQQDSTHSNTISERGYFSRWCIRATCKRAPCSHNSPNFQAKIQKNAKKPKLFFNQLEILMHCAVLQPEKFYIKGENVGSSLSKFFRGFSILKTTNWLFIVEALGKYKNLLVESSHGYVCLYSDISVIWWLLVDCRIIMLNICLKQKRRIIVGQTLQGKLPCCIQANVSKNMENSGILHGTFRKTIHAAFKNMTEVDSNMVDSYRTTMQNFGWIKKLVLHIHLYIPGDWLRDSRCKQLPWSWQTQVSLAIIMKKMALVMHSRAKAGIIHGRHVMVLKSLPWKFMILARIRN